MTGERDHLDFEELERFVDDDLGAGARARVDELLERSEEARRWVAVRRALLARVASLPDEVEPESDLWPDLASRIRREGEPAEALEPRPRESVGDAPVSAARRKRWIALAATLLVTLGLGSWLGYRFGQQKGTTLERAAVEGAAVERVPVERMVERASATPAAVPIGPGGSTRDAMSAAERALIEVKRELRRSLEQYRDVLPADTTRSLDANLDTIERSISELRRAIEANPESTELRHALMSYHENEITLLNRVTRAASRL